MVCGTVRRAGQVAKTTAAKQYDRRGAGRAAGSVDIRQPGNHRRGAPEGATRRDFRVALTIDNG